jgi:hypothetical protein
MDRKIHELEDYQDMESGSDISIHSWHALPNLHAGINLFYLKSCVTPDSMCLKSSHSPKRLMWNHCSSNTQLSNGFEPHAQTCRLHYEANPASFLRVAASNCFVGRGQRDFQEHNRLCDVLDVQRAMRQICRNGNTTGLSDDMLLMLGA